MEVIDLKKDLKHLYNSTKKAPAILEVPKMKYLMFDGKGHPNEPDFQIAAEAIYTVSYLLKFEIARKRCNIDYKVMPMEVIWNLSREDKISFFWTMMIMQPSFITDEMFSEAIELSIKKGKKIAHERLRFEEAHSTTLTKFVITNEDGKNLVTHNGYDVTASFIINYTLFVHIRDTKINYQFVNQTVDSTGHITIDYDYSVSMVDGVIVENELMPTIKSQTPNTYIKYSYNGSTFKFDAPTFTQAGTYEIEYMVYGDTFETVESSLTFVVHKIDYNIELVNTLDKVYDGSVVVPEYVVTNYDGVFYANIQYTNNNQRVYEARNAGDYVMTITIAESSNYDRTEFVKEFSIAKANISVAMDLESLYKIYDGEATNPTGTVGFRNATFDGTNGLAYIGSSVAGLYVVDEINGGYKLTEDLVAKTGTIYYSKVNDKYIPKTDDARITSTINGLTVTYNYFDSDNNPLDYHPINAGNYKVKVLVAESENFKAYESDLYSYVIVKRDLYYGSDVRLYKSYDKEVFTTNYLAILAMNAQDSKFAVTATVSTVGYGQGIYETADQFAIVITKITYNGADVDVQENINVILSLSVEITNAQAEVTVIDYNGIFDELAHGIEIEARGIGNAIIPTSDYKIYYSADGENYDAEEIIKYTNVGSYDIYIKVVFNDYDTVNVVGHVVIEKADQIIEIVDPTRIYNKEAIADPAVHSLTGSAVNTLSSKTPTYKYYQNNNPVKGNPVNAGTYTVEVTIEGDDNYNSGTATLEFRIIEMTVELLWTNTTRTYTGSVVLPTANYTTVTYDVLTISLTSNVPTIDVNIDSDAYIVTAELDNPNYVISENDKTCEFYITNNAVETPLDIEEVYTGSPIYVKPNEL